MKAYSLDLRERILRAVDDGHADRQVAQRFCVSPATVKRYRRQRRESGSVDPKPIPGRPRAIPPDQHPALWAQLAAHPDATLVEHCQHWQATQGVAVCFSTMARASKRLGWTRKKRRWWPPNATRSPAPLGERRWLPSTPTALSSSTRPAATSP